MSSISARQMHMHFYKMIITRQLTAITVSLSKGPLAQQRTKLCYKSKLQGETEQTPLGRHRQKWRKWIEIQGVRILLIYLYF